MKVGKKREKMAVWLDGWKELKKEETNERRKEGRKECDVE